VGKRPTQVELAERIATGLLNRFPGYDHNRLKALILKTIQGQPGPDRKDPDGDDRVCMLMAFFERMKVAPEDTLKNLLGLKSKQYARMLAYYRYKGNRARFKKLTADKALRIEKDVGFTVGPAEPVALPAKVILNLDEWAAECKTAARKFRGAL